MNAREQARKRDEVARRRLDLDPGCGGCGGELDSVTAGCSTCHNRSRKRRYTVARRAERRRLRARVRELESNVLPDDRDELEALREELVERLERVEALLVVPGAHWQRLAA